eukprot:gene12563-26456_t
MEQDSAPDQFLENRIYGDYEVLRAIGKGKFAVVYRARRRSDGETVALKRISVDMMDEKAREKCLKEVRLLQSLDHPNIVRYLDSFISENDLVIVVEWAAAGDLKRQLRKAQERNVGFDERVIWKYFSQMCDALKHMHDKRIMHRDLKPANIFLTIDGTVKVGDLGLSRELSADTVQAHSKVGTPLYMSPEVLRGDGYDFKSDVWSLGCLLYELAMLKSPFKSESLSLYTLFQKIAQGSYEPLPEAYSDDLKHLAYSMICTAPGDRPELQEVCEHANRMRIFTAEKYLKAKKEHSQKGTSSSTTTNVTYTTTTATNSKINSDNEINNENEMKSHIQNKNNNHDNDNENDNDENNGRQQSRVKGTDYSDGYKSKERDRDRERGRDRRGSRDSREEEEDHHNGNGYGHINNNNNGHNVNKDYGGGDYEVPRDRDRDKDRGRGRDQQYVATTSPKQQQQRGSDSHNINNNNGRNPSKTTTQNHNNNINTNTTPSDGVDHYYSSRKPSSRKSSTATAYEPTGEDEETFERVVTGPPGSMGSGTGTGLKKTNEEEVEEKFRTTGAAIYYMELFYSKLELLGYSLYSGNGSGNRDRSRSKDHILLPIHFISDSSVIPVKVTGGITQFQRFVEIVEWLCTQYDVITGSGIGRSDSTSRFDVEENGPITIAKQILGIAEKMGYPTTELMNIPPTAMIHGHGDKVCMFLNAMTDIVLKCKGHSWKQMKYDDEGNLNNEVQTEPL